MKKKIQSKHNYSLLKKKIFFKNTIKSILNQTYQNFEIIVFMTMIMIRELFCKKILKTNTK